MLGPFQVKKVTLHRHYTQLVCFYISPRVNQAKHINGMVTVTFCISKPSCCRWKCKARLVWVVFYVSVATFLSDFPWSGQTDKRCRYGAYPQLSESGSNPEHRNTSLTEETRGIFTLFPAAAKKIQNVLQIQAEQIKAIRTETGAGKENTWEC